MGDHLIVANALFAHFLVHGSGQTAVFAAQQALGFLGDHLIALAAQDVHHSLSANDLAGGRYQRRIAKVLAHARYFRQHVVILIHGVSLLELPNQVGQHAARHLIQKRVRIRGKHARGIAPALLGKLIRHLAEIRRDLGKQLQVKAGVAFGSLQRGHHGFGCRLGGAVAKRAQAGVNHVNAGFHSL